MMVVINLCAEMLHPLKLVTPCFAPVVLSFAARLSLGSDIHTSLWALQLQYYNVFPSLHVRNAVCGVVTRVATCTRWQMLVPRHHTLVRAAVFWQWDKAVGQWSVCPACLPSVCLSVCWSTIADCPLTTTTHLSTWPVAISRHHVHEHACLSISTIHGGTRHNDRLQHNVTYEFNFKKLTTVKLLTRKNAMCV